MWQQQNLQFLLQFLAAPLCIRVFFLTQRLQLGIGLTGHHLRSLLHVPLRALIAAEGGDDRLQLLLLLQIRRSPLRVGIKIRLLRAGAQLHIFFFHQFQLVQHK